MDLNQGTPRPSASFPHALPKAHPRCTLVPQNQKCRNHTPHRPSSHRRPHPEVQACSLRSCRPYGPTGPSPCISEALQGHCNGSQSPTWLEEASRSATHDLVRPAKERQWETSIEHSGPGLKTDCCGGGTRRPCQAMRPSSSSSRATYGSTDKDGIELQMVGLLMME